MKTKILIAFIIVACFNACSKDKFSVKPQLTFKSVNTDVLYPNQILEFQLHYTDKDGDIQNTKFFIQKISLNCTLAGSSFIDTSNVIPESVPQKTDAEGDVVVRYLYGIADNIAIITGPVCNKNDTCIFRFVLRDKANNVSDTVTSPQVVIIKN